MIKEDGQVIHFNNPKVQASLAANTFAITGHAETKRMIKIHFLPSDTISKVVTFLSFGAGYFKFRVFYSKTFRKLIFNYHLTNYWNTINLAFTLTLKERFMTSSNLSSSLMVILAFKARRSATLNKVISYVAIWELMPGLMQQMDMKDFLRFAPQNLNDSYSGEISCKGQNLGNMQWQASSRTASNWVWGPSWMWGCPLHVQRMNGRKCWRTGFLFR